MSIQKIDLSDLTPEQVAQLREQLRREEVVAENREAAASVEGVYTNVSSRAVTIPDLFMKAGSSVLYATFAPGETKDLKETYKLREIRASKFLPKLEKQGKLQPGRVAVDLSAKDPVTQLATLRPEGTFDDPMAGNRPYDLKLAEVERKERERNGDHLLR